MEGITIEFYGECFFLGPIAMKPYRNDPWDM